MKENNFTVSDISRISCQNPGQFVNQGSVVATIIKGKRINNQ